MKPLRILIVDDEPIARQTLKRILGEFEQIKVCGQSGCVKEAAAMARQVKADAVYLDAALFGESGFDLIPKLDPDVAVVFVTAFNQFAIRAFEVNALDYLLKPVTRERLSETVRRLCKQKRFPSAPWGRENLRISEKVLVKDKSRRCWLKLEDVYVIEANGDFTTLRSIHGQSGHAWQRMGEWERILPEAFFFPNPSGLAGES